jgi:putative tryptophan/tyrosine transport system substrate-binding protein
LGAGLVVKRREFILLVGGAAAVWPLAAGAQQQRVWRIGFLSGKSEPSSLATTVYGEFLNGMNDFGYTEGRDFTMEWRFVAGDFSRLPGMAADLVARQVDVIIAGFTGAALAAKKATSSIPIILGYAADPVGSGLVESLARPGGNVTGLATYLPELASKQFELLTAVVPKLSRVGILMNPNNLAYVGMLKTTRGVAAATGIELALLEARSTDETKRAFERLEEQVEAVMVVPDPVYDPPRTVVADLALKHRLPSIHPYAEYTALGGLMSYGDSLGKFYRRAAYFVDKIFKGAQPRELPVEQPTTFEFVINLRTAKALGLDVPATLLARADKLLE